MTKISIITNKACYGCMLCVSKCPVGAIGFVSDNCGFVSSRIDSDACIECGICERQCIANYPPSMERTVEKAYSAVLFDAGLLCRSASGGAAYGLGLAQLTSGGVVYGVAYTEDFRAAEYIRIDSEKDLSKLQDSKYFHAKEGSKKKLFEEVDQDLKNQQPVLVIGLPCEIAALRKAFDGKKGLTLGELFCHGVTSVETHEKYLNMTVGAGKVCHFSVKAKIKGWQKNPYIYINTSEGKTVQEQFYSSSYGYAFAHLSRESCYACQFKGNHRAGDLSIGDFWGILNTGENYNKDGVSVIQVHTDQGMKLLEKSGKYLQLNPIDTNIAIVDNAWVEKSIPLNDREVYARRFSTDKRIYIPAKVKLKKLIKSVIGR